MVLVADISARIRAEGLEATTTAIKAVGAEATQTARALEIMAAAAVKSGGGTTAGWLDRQSLALKSKQQNAMADTRKYVVVHPLQSIAIALVAGLVLGRWLR